tara:strand:- start:439 stop:972 length:534 start_codon:yes stop_codon:yes gene_type:complete
MPLKRKRRSKYKKKKSLKKRNYTRKRSQKRRRRKRKKSRCKRSRKVYRKRKNRKGYRGVQTGCAKQKGGANCSDYNCEYPHNMGEIMTGTKNNLQGSDLIPETTQNRLPSLAPKQSGGGLIGFDGLGTSKLIDFGLSHPLTTARNGMNYMRDMKNTWNADRKVASADPTIPGNMDDS